MPCCASSPPHLPHSDKSELTLILHLLASVSLVATCELYHDDCAYTAEQDGRRPAAKQYVTALEERVKVLERMLKQGETLGEDEGGQGPDGGEDGAGQETADIGLDRLKVRPLPFGPSSLSPLLSC